MNDDPEGDTLEGYLICNNIPETIQLTGFTSNASGVIAAHSNSAFIRRVNGKIEKYKIETLVG